jgi:hypothetical protein
VHVIFFTHASAGVYEVVRLLIATKLVLGVTMWLSGQHSLLLLCLFIASNRIFTEVSLFAKSSIKGWWLSLCFRYQGTCKLLNLVVGDLVDEDYITHNRAAPISALIFGTTAFLSKPGQVWHHFFYISCTNHLFFFCRR